MRKRQLQQITDLYSYLNTVDQETWTDNERKMKCELDQLMAELKMHSEHGVMIAKNGADLLREMGLTWKTFDSIFRNMVISNENRRVWADKCRLDDFFAGLLLELQEDFPQEELTGAPVAEVREKLEKEREEKIAMAKETGFIPGIENIIKTPDFSGGMGLAEQALAPIAQSYTTQLVSFRDGSYKKVDVVDWKHSQWIHLTKRNGNVVRINPINVNYIEEL